MFLTNKRPCALVLISDGTDRLPDATEFVVPVDTTGSVVHVPRAAWVVRLEGGRPVVADGTRIAETAILPEASGRKENPFICISRLFAGYLSSVNAVFGCPCPVTIVH